MAAEICEHCGLKIELVYLVDDVLWGPAWVCEDCRDEFYAEVQKRWALRPGTRVEVHEVPGGYIVFPEDRDAG